MDGLLIREARREDLPAIVALLSFDDIGKAVDTGDPALFPFYERAFDRIAASPNESLFVGELADEIVATFQIVINSSLPYRGTTRCILEAVQVRPDMRGRRIGEALVHHAMAEGRRRGADIMTLSSNATRLDAHRFYERLGFAKSHAGFKIAL